MANILPPVEFATITGRFMVAGNDSDDPGAEADIVPAKGKGSIIPSVGHVLVAGATPPATVKLATVYFEIDSEGYICDAETKERNVEVIAPSEAVNPSAFTYRINFDGGLFPGFDFYVVPGSTIDLTDVGRVATSVGVATTRGEPGVGIESMTLSPDQSSLVVIYDNLSEQTVEIPALGEIAQQAQATTDEVIATALADPNSATRAAGNATYAPFGSASRPSARAVVIGCSIENLHSFRTTGATSSSEQFGGGDWPTWAMLLSGGRFHLVRNMGIGGQTTSQYLARFDDDVAPSVGRDTLGQANVVVIGGLENDIQQPTYSLEASRANIVEMVNRTRSLGAVPILRTTMPHFLSAAVRTKIGAANQWIRNYGVEQGIIVLDFWRLVVDPATGQYRANMTADGVHPNELASRAMGQHAADVLAAAGPPVASSALAFDPTDTGLLAPNPLFLTDTAGTPTTWNALGGTPTGVTRSMVTDPQVPGRMARIAHAGSTTDNVGIANNSSIINTTKASPGEIVEVLGVVTSDGGVRATVNVSINYNDGTAKNIGRAVYFASAVTRGEYRFRLPPLPDGFTNVIVTFLTNKGTGVVDFSYPTVRNLTREGAI